MPGGKLSAPLLIILCKLYFLKLFASRKVHCTWDADRKFRGEFGKVLNYTFVQVIF